jgi:hypothetical protein
MKSLLSLRVMVPSKSVKKMNLGSLKGNRRALRSVAAIVYELIGYLVSRKVGVVYQKEAQGETIIESDCNLTANPHVAAKKSTRSRCHS